MKFKDKIIRFMYGRYGTDELYYGMLALYFALFVVTLFTDWIWVHIVMWVCLILSVLRMLSKNHIARARENRVFLKIINPIKGFFTTNFVRLRDIRKKRYRTCKNCKAVLRLPIKKGTHTVRCPKCGKQFKVKILF